MRLHRLRAVGTCTPLLFAVVIALAACAPATRPAGARLGEATASPVSQPAVQRRIWFPKHIGASALGETGAEVRRVFGNGLFREDDPYGDGHYYVNKDHSATLHVQTDTDDSVSAVELTTGVDLPAGTRLTTATLSPAFSAGAPTWDGLALGSSYSQVVNRFGSPDSEHMTDKGRVLEYALSSGDRSVTAELVLVGDKLQTIGIFAPD